MTKIIGFVGAFALASVVCVIAKANVRNAVVMGYEKKPLKAWGPVLMLLAYIGGFMALAKTATSDSLIMLALYFFVPVVAVFTHSLTPFAWEKSNFLALFVLLALWIPVETRLVLKVVDVGGMKYPYIALSAIIVGLMMLTWKGKRELSLDWSFPKGSGPKTKFLLSLILPLWIPLQSFWTSRKTIGLAFLLLSAIMIPLGFLIGFTELGVSKMARETPYLLPLVLVAMWFLPALAEEVIFRAGLQNIFSDWFGKWAGWLAASAVFGLAHVNNSIRVGERTIGTPNWLYVCLATIAGLFYGYVYNKRKAAGSPNALGAAAALHALVDFVWRLFFMGGR